MSKTEIVILVGIAAMVVGGGWGIRNRKAKLEAEKVEISEWTNMVPWDTNSADTNPPVDNLIVSSPNLAGSILTNDYYGSTVTTLSVISSNVIHRTTNDWYKSTITNMWSPSIPAPCDIAIDGDYSAGRMVTVTSKHGTNVYRIVDGEIVSVETNSTRAFMTPGLPDVEVEMIRDMQMVLNE